MLSLSVNKYPNISQLLENKNNHLVDRNLLNFNYLYTDVKLHHYYAYQAFLF